MFRQCTESDLPHVQKLADQLYAEDPKTPDVRTDVSRTLQEFQSKPDKGQLIVFDDGESIIGYCIIIFFWSNEYGGNVIDIDEICVTQERRRSSIATDLITWLEKRFAEDAVGYTLEVSSDNTAACNLVSKLGFTPVRNQHMIKILKRP
jgi:ribosomal protein S18 acetylase RimI-like enzyme